MKLYLILACSFIIAACSPNPYSKTNKVYKRQAKGYSKELSRNSFYETAPYKVPNDWVGTTNFNMRKPNMVVIHHTAQKNCNQTLRTFTLARTQVSSHYVICKDGTVHQTLNDYLRAWHAGKGQWGTVTDVNSASIGIELDNNGKEYFSELQMLSLENLLEDLKGKYNIPQKNFIGHADMAPTRKSDPNIYFDWERIANKGYGVWYPKDTLVLPPSYFKPMHALKMIGYDISDSVAVTRVFKRKYLKKEDEDPWTQKDLRVLYALWRHVMKN